MPHQAAVALYRDFAQARHAVNALETAGVLPSDISVVANDAGGALAAELAAMDPEETARAKATGMGLTLGLMAGGTVGLLSGLGTLAIPGIGPVLAGGMLASALAGAGFGAAAGVVFGGLVGALIDVGVPEQLAHVYSEAVRRGGTLVAVSASADDVPWIAEILARFEPLDVEALDLQYRREGWRAPPPADPTRSPKAPE